MSEHRVAAAVLRCEGRVLLCHRNPDRAWYPGCWDLPGGHLGPGEAPDDAVVRECREELGVEVTAAREVEHDLALPGVELHLYVVDDWTGTVANLAPDEHDDLGWFSVAELADLGLADPRYPAVLGALLG